jgi:hypothetical protein
MQWGVRHFTEERLRRKPGVNQIVLVLQLDLVLDSED